VHNQAHVPAVSAMTVPDHALLLQHGIGPALGHLINHLRQVDEPLDRTHRYAVVQGDDHCISAISIHDPFNANSLADLAQFSSSLKC